MTSKDKGWTIGNSDVIREVHNSFARQDPFTIEEDDDRKAKDDDDVFHFIGYVPYEG
jgi:ubiquitin carboxyl-terminal hydrolase L5